MIGRTTGMCCCRGVVDDRERRVTPSRIISSLCAQQNLGVESAMEGHDNVTLNE